MRTILKSAVLAIAVCGVTLSGGCAALGGLFGDPAAVPGALPSEATELRIIRAALTVRGAYEATSEQLERGTITVAQAASRKAQIDKANEAVKLASTASALEDGTLADRLALLDSLLLEILRNQRAN